MIAMVPLRGPLAALALIVLTGLARADDASPWVRDAHSAVRLLAGSRSGAVVLGGIAFQLDPDWKTYWRSPGDSGVPPRFDFSRSDNVEAVTVLWPAPMRFSDGSGGFSIGYRKEVVLPLRVVAKNPEKPLILRAAISYAVCEKLCLPVEANLELDFSSVASTQDSVLAAALDSVPVPAQIGDPNPVTIRDARRDGPRRVIVDAVAPAEARLDLFAEGPTPDWSLPLPEPVKDAPPGVRRFAFDLDGAPPGARFDGATLRLTLVGPERAYEYTVSLD